MITKSVSFIYYDGSNLLKISSSALHFRSTDITSFPNIYLNFAYFYRRHHTNNGCEFSMNIVRNKNLAVQKLQVKWNSTELKLKFRVKFVKPKPTVAPIISLKSKTSLINAMILLIIID